MHYFRACMEVYKQPIIFLGTPLFAATILQALINAQFNVVAVVTAPDKPAGRGMQLQQSEVKKIALLHNLPVLQPPKLKDPEFIAQLASYQATVQVVVAFRMLPELVWHMPPLGTINLHASLLPMYRGAAPINWAIINGETSTGITTFKLKHEIDTGDILLQEKISIPPHYNAGLLHDELMHKGAALVVRTMQQYLAGELQETPQLQNAHTPHAPKIFTETCAINWQNNAASIHQLIRGLSPYPTAFTLLDGKKIKIFASTYTQEEHSYSAGSVHTDQKTFLRLATTDGWVYATDVQLEGKKRMAVEDFLRGYKVN